MLAPIVVKVFYNNAAIKVIGMYPVKNVDNWDKNPVWLHPRVVHILAFHGLYVFYLNLRYSLFHFLKFWLTGTCPKSMQPYNFILFHLCFSYKFDLIIFCTPLLHCVFPSPTLEKVSHRIVAIIFIHVLSWLLSYNLSHYFSLSFKILQFLYETHRNMTSVKCIERARELEREYSWSTWFYFLVLLIIVFCTSTCYYYVLPHSLQFCTISLSISSLNTLEKRI